MLHLLSQSHECAFCGFPRRVSRRFSKRLRQLRVAEAQLDSGDDSLAFLGLQPRERGFVAFDHLAPNRPFERTLRIINLETVEIGDLWPPPFPAQFVAN